MKTIDGEESEMKTIDREESGRDNHRNISTLQKPFDTVFYTYWWEPGSKSQYHKKCVDDDGKYQEFNTIAEALEDIKIQRRNIPGGEWYVFAVVKHTYLTVRLIHPSAKHKTTNRKGK